MYLEFYPIRKTFLWVNRCIWKMCRYIWEKKILLILRQHLFARNVLLALPNYYVFMQETQPVESHFQRNSGCGNFKLWTLLQEDICHCDAWSKLAKKWGMCSMTWFSHVSMSQWGLPKDVTVIGIWWLGHFPSSQPPLPPRPPSSASPLPPKSIWPGQPTKLAKTCSLKQGPRDLAHHPSPFPRSMKRNLSLEKFTPDSTSNCLSSHTYSVEANWENCCGMFCFCKSERAFKQFLFSGVLIVDLAKSRKLSSLLKNPRTSGRSNFKNKQQQLQILQHSDIKCTPTPS